MLKILKKRRFRVLLACISLLLVINMIQDTYAKYISSASANSSFSISRWAFLVNTQDVLSNSDFSNTIIPTWDANQNIASGVIAPTSTGSFQITIDSSNVDVAFNETITLSQGDDNTVTDLVFSGYKLNNGSVVNLNDVTTTTITSSHSVGEQNTTNTYTIYVKWNDNALTETMDNSDDADAAVNGEASIKVDIDFVQASTANNNNNNNSNEP